MYATPSKLYSMKRYTYPEHLLVFFHRSTFQSRKFRFVA